MNSAGWSEMLRDLVNRGHRLDHLPTVAGRQQSCTRPLHRRCGFDECMFPFGCGLDLTLTEGALNERPLSRRTA